MQSYGLSRVIVSVKRDQISIDEFDFRNGVLMDILYGLDRKNPLPLYQHLRMMMWK